MFAGESTQKKNNRKTKQNETPNGQTASNLSALSFLITFLTIYSIWFNRAVDRTHCCFGAKNMKSFHTDFIPFHYNFKQHRWHFRYKNKWELVWPLASCLLHIAYSVGPDRFVHLQYWKNWKCAFGFNEQWMGNGEWKELNFERSGKWCFNEMNIVLFWFFFWIFFYFFVLFFK